jgi:glycosyltransferase involved in cell wall biosynthesis
MSRVSVVLPVYNRAQFVADAIRSVLEQGYKDFELIVVDDGSTDDTPGVLKEFSDRAEIIRQDNKGPAAARNRAIQRSRGELIAFIDSDDIWLPQKLEAQVAFLDDNPAIGMVHCDGWVVEEFKGLSELQPDATFYRKKKPPFGDTAKSRIMKTAIVTSHVVVRREVMDRVGLFPEDLLVHEDVDLFFRMLEAGVEIGFVEKPLVVKRVLSDSLAMDQLRYILQALDVEYRSWMRSHVLREHLKPAIIFNHRLAAWALYLEGDRKGARSHCLKALRMKPLSPRTAMAALALSLPEGLTRSYLDEIFPAGELEKVWDR